MLMKKRSLKNKGQICYIIQDSDIKSVELIKITAANIYIVKDTETNKEQYIHSNLIYDTENENRLKILNKQYTILWEIDEKLKGVNITACEIDKNLKGINVSNSGTLLKLNV